MILELVECWCERTEAPEAVIGCGPHAAGRLALSVAVCGVTNIVAITPEYARRVAAMLERWAEKTEN